MIKKTMTYYDFDGKLRTESAYFGYTPAEIMEQELETEEGLVNKLESLINSGDDPELMKRFRELILDTYGEKTPDGRHFFKSPELSAKFKATPMYSEIYMELITQPDKAVEFIKGIMPAERTEEEKAAMAKTNYERVSDEIREQNIVPMPSQPVINSAD